MNVYKISIIIIMITIMNINLLVLNLMGKLLLNNLNTINYKF